MLRSDKDEDTLDRILSKITSLEKKIDKIDDMEKSMSFISTEFELQRKAIAELVQDKKDSHRKISDMELQIKFLKEQMSEAHSGYEYLLNEQRKNNAEIRGIPVQPNEDLKLIVKRLTVKAGAGVIDNDITSIRRLKNKTAEASSIIVVFKEEDKRNLFIKSCRGARVKCDDVGITGAGPIYVNEDVSWITRKVFGLANNFKKVNSWAEKWKSFP